MRWSTRSTTPPSASPPSPPSPPISPPPPPSHSIHGVPSTLSHHHHPHHKPLFCSDDEDEQDYACDHHFDDDLSDSYNHYPSSSSVVSDSQPPLCSDTSVKLIDDTVVGPASAALAPPEEWRVQSQQSTCEFTHTISHYSSKRESGCKKAEYSATTVDAYGNRWRLIIYVNGNGRASNHHLSLFLQVADADELPFGWKKAVSYVLTLEHPSGPSLGYAKRNPDKTFKLCPKAIDWGWSQFITSDRIQQEGYVSNDSLTVRASVTVKSSSVSIDPEDAELYLKCAVEEGNAEAVKACLAQGAAVNCQFKDDLYTPLHTACSSSASTGSLDVLKLLLDRGADGNACNKWRETPLLIAANNGHRAAVEALLEYGADPSLCSEAGWSALTFAAHKGYEDIVALLLGSGAPVNCRVTEDLSTPLHKACAGGKPGHLSAVKQLLAGGADVHALNKWRETPLLTAANHGQAAAVDALLRAGADPCKCTDTGWSPLSIAAYKGHDDVVRMLLEEGAPTEEADPTLSALLQAATKGLPDTVELLLRHGADHTVTTKKGDTALSILVEQNLIDAAVEMVTEYKASVPRCSRDRKKVARARLLINLRVKQQQKEGLLNMDDDTDDSEQDESDDGGNDALHVLSDSSTPAAPDKKKNKKKSKSRESAEAKAREAEEELLQMIDQQESLSNEKAAAASNKRSKKRRRRKRELQEREREKAEKERLEKEREEKEREKKQKEKEAQDRERMQKLREKEQMKREILEQLAREEHAALRKKEKDREERERKQREQEKKERERKSQAYSSSAGGPNHKNYNKLAYSTKTKTPSKQRHANVTISGNSNGTHTPEPSRVRSTPLRAATRSSGKHRGWETKNPQSAISTPKTTPQYPSRQLRTPSPTQPSQVLQRRPAPNTPKTPLSNHKPYQAPVQPPPPPQPLSPAPATEPRAAQPSVAPMSTPLSVPPTATPAEFSVEDQLEDITNGVVDFLGFDSPPSNIKHNIISPPIISTPTTTTVTNGLFQPPQMVTETPLITELPAVAVYRQEKLNELLSRFVEPTSTISLSTIKTVIYHYMVRASHASSPYLDPVIPSWTDNTLVSFLQRQLISKTHKSGNIVNIEILKEAGSAIADLCQNHAKDVNLFREETRSQLNRDWSDVSVGVTATEIGGMVVLDWAGQSQIYLPTMTFSELKRRYRGLPHRLLTHVFVMTKRYETKRILTSGTAMDYRLPPAVLRCLAQEVKVTVEACADPLSAQLPIFFAIFPDVDAAFTPFPTFGHESAGKLLSRQGGSVVLLPPLETSTGQLYVQKAVSLLEQTELPLSFILFLRDASDDLSLLDPRLNHSGFVRAVEQLKENCHVYFPHLGGTPESVNSSEVTSHTSTLLLILQNGAGRGAYNISDAAIVSILSSLSLRQGGSASGGGVTSRINPNPFSNHTAHVGRRRLFALVDDGEEEEEGGVGDVTGMFESLNVFERGEEVDVDIEAISLMGIRGGFGQS